MELTVRWYITKCQRLNLKTFGLGKWRRCRKRRIWSLDLWTTTYWRFLKTLPFFSSEIITCLFAISRGLYYAFASNKPAATWWCGGAFTHAPWQLWQQGRIFERLRESIRNIIKIPYVSQLFSQ